MHLKTCVSNFNSKKFRFVHILYIMPTVICLEAYWGANHFHWTTSEIEADNKEVMTEHEAQLIEEYAHHMRDEHNNSI